MIVRVRTLQNVFAIIKIRTVDSEVILFQSDKNKSMCIMYRSTQSRRVQAECVYPIYIKCFPVGGGNENRKIKMQRSSS